MEFNQISANKKIKYFEYDLESILINFILSSSVTMLPLVVRSMILFLNGDPIIKSADVFFSDRDMLIILVSIVSSAAFVSYKYLERKPLRYFCWVCVAISFGTYLSENIRIDMSRGLLWFVISIVFSIVNILASQYIPKDRR